MGHRRWVAVVVEDTETVDVAEGGGGCVLAQVVPADGVPVAPVADLGSDDGTRLEGNNVGPLPTGFRPH